MPKTQTSPSKADRVAEAVQRFDKLPGDALLSVDTVCALLAISAPTAWRWARQGKLASPVRHGLRCTRWRVTDIRQALAAMGGRE